MTRDLDRKLRLTAAALGAATLKDLARAFHRADPATRFDPERAAKWLQGRARPRDQAIYEEWAALLGLGRSPAWLRECGADDLLAALGDAHGIGPGLLLERAEAFGRRGPADAGRAGAAAAGQALCGTFASYRHSFSPYYGGRLIRGSLRIEAKPGGAPVARYAERLPTGMLRARGRVDARGRSVYVDLTAEAGDEEPSRGFWTLFKPAPPASLLAGLHCGATLLGAAPEPSCSRLAIVRVPAEDPAPVERSNRYMEAGESIADDLTGLGLPAGDGAAALDRGLRALLGGGTGGGLDQVDGGAYAVLVDAVDRLWLAASGAAGPQAAPPPLKRA